MFLEIFSCDRPACIYFFQILDTTALGEVQLVGAGVGVGVGVKIFMRLT